MFFFFKQKTAYELRISDWSSDVGSSDLFGRRRIAPHIEAVFEVTENVRSKDESIRAEHDTFVTHWTSPRPASPKLVLPLSSRHEPSHARTRGPSPAPCSRTRGVRTRTSAPRKRRRSDEHTSELQSLMPNT